MGSGESTLAAAGAQVLTFRLGAETYGVDKLRVKEIRGWSAVTRTPQSSPPVVGVLQLRGATVPIVDLRQRFAMEPAEFTRLTVIIVLSLYPGQGTKECGIVVDSLSDLVDDAAHATLPPALIMLDLDSLALLDPDRLDPVHSSSAPERRKDSRPWAESKSPATLQRRNEGASVARDDAVWQEF
jgi:chemotaxis signal transduction protein